MQVLIWPSHPPLVEVGRREKPKVDLFDGAKPAVTLAGPDSLVVLQQSVTGRIAVIIERDDAVGYIDMISQKAFGRDNALRIKIGKWRLLQENTSENMAGAVPEEDTVRKRPLPMRIGLDALI